MFYGKINCGFEDRIFRGHLISTIENILSADKVKRDFAYERREKRGFTDGIFCER